MHCIIISENAGFPWGMAATSRVRNLAKALMIQGIDIQYLGLRGANTSYQKNKRMSGIADGIKYKYPGFFLVRSRKWCVRRIDDFLSKWLTLIEIARIKKQKDFDTAIIYSRNYTTVMFWAKKLKRMGIKVVLELCEWPLANASDGDKKLENARKFCYQAILNVDAILPISRYIEDVVKDIAGKNGKIIPTFRIPILTDHVLSASHVGENEHKNSEEYVLYSGSVNYMDIAYFVVDVMSELKTKGCKLKLKFTGGGERLLFNKIRAYASKFNIVDQVEFTGYLEEETLFIYMVNALCLLAPLPETEQSRARFPTKIGYYLSSGRPVVTNAVGSVNEFLTDGENAYVANRFDAIDVAEKVIEILDDPLRANRIGTRGQQLANKLFFYKNACVGLKEFLENTAVNMNYTMVKKTKNLKARGIKTTTN